LYMSNLQVYRIPVGVSHMRIRFSVRLGRGYFGYYPEGPLAVIQPESICAGKYPGNEGLPGCYSDTRHVTRNIVFKLR